MSDDNEAGDFSAERLEQWFHRYYSSVFQFFVNRGFDREDSHDLAQETFVAAFKGRGHFRGESSVKTWIFSIALNQWKNQLRYRSQKKRKAIEVSLDQPRRPEEDPPEVEVEATEGNPLAKLLQKELATHLMDSLEKLPRQMGRCAYLRYGQHLKYADIADILDISIDTVKSHLFHANRRLKKNLRDYLSESEGPAAGDNHE